jgi:hypothetical protein
METAAGWFARHPEVEMGLVQTWGGASECRGIFSPVLRPRVGRGVDFEIGGSRGPGSWRGRHGDQQARGPRRYCQSGTDPHKSERVARAGSARDLHRAGKGARDPAAGLPLPRWGLPGERLSCPRDRDAVRTGDIEAASVSLCRLRPHRDRHQLAVALPLDTGTGPDPGTPVRSDDVPGER